MIHLLTERNPKCATTKCGRTVTYAETSGFQSAVDCPACRAIIDQGPPHEAVRAPVPPPVG